MPFLYVLYLVVFLVSGLLFPTLGAAQLSEMKASCVSDTGTNATIILPDTSTAVVNESALQPGDTLLALDPNGACVGHTTYSGTGDALTVWGRGLFGETTAGLQPGDPLMLCVWQHNNDTLLCPTNSTLDITLDTSAPYLIDDLQYAQDGLYVVKELRIAVHE